jgi:hypothetical protein
MNQIIGRCARMLKDWCWIQKPQDAVVLERWAEGFEKNLIMSCYHNEPGATLLSEKKREQRARLTTSMDPNINEPVGFCEN